MALIRQGVVVRWCEKGIISFENKLGQNIPSHSGDDKHLVPIATNPGMFEGFVAGLASIHGLSFMIRQRDSRGRTIACEFL